MSITRDHGNVVFECDECGETFDTEEKDFDTALVIMKDREDWLITKEADEWIHICPSCCDD